MAELSRYSSKESETDPHFLNKLGISSLDALEKAEAILLKETYDHFFSLQNTRKIVFDTKFLISIHHHFFTTLYSWAGKFRTVDISKDNVLFASSRFIPELLKDFDKQLPKLIPKNDDSKREIATKLAFIHNELNAIHPFREGNGRTLRLFLDLISNNISYLPIEWSKSTIKTYFDACRAGMKGDNKPMEKVIYKGLTKRK